MTAASLVRLACDNVFLWGAVAFLMAFRFPRKFCKPSHISLRLMQWDMWQYSMLTMWLHMLKALGAILMPSLSSAAHTFERLCFGISLQNWPKTVNLSVVLWVFLFTHRLWVVVGQSQSTISVIRQIFPASQLRHPYAPYGTAMTPVLKAPLIHWL